VEDEEGVYLISCGNGRRHIPYPYQREARKKRKKDSPKRRVGLSGSAVGREGSRVTLEETFRNENRLRTVEM